MQWGSEVTLWKSQYGDGESRAEAALHTGLWDDWRTRDDGAESPG